MRFSNFSSPSTTMSTSVSTTAGTASEDMTIPISSSVLLRGLEDKVQLFLGITNMRKVVSSHSKDLQAGRTTDQYLVFKPVTTDDFKKIDNKRHIIGNLRLTHCIDLDTLVVKLMPSLRHEFAHRSFGDLLKAQRQTMGFSASEFMDVGGTTYHGHVVSKEADSAFKPRPRRPNPADWPTIVLEAGVSKSLRQLKNNARWWLSNSGGQVHIVLIFSIQERSRTIQIEKWETRPTTGRVTRSNQPPAQVPRLIQQIIIDPNNVTRAPLILDFHLVFLRAINQNAVPPEHDFTLTAQDLRNWADEFWISVV